MNSKRCQLFFPVFSTPDGTILGEMNIEMTNPKMCHMHLFKEEEEEHVGGKLMKEKNFIGGKKKNWLEKMLRYFRMQ